MKQAIVRWPHYRVVMRDIKLVAEEFGILPCQMQAVLWFTRKRVLNIVYDPQYDMFADHIDVSQILPYPRNCGDVKRKSSPRQATNALPPSEGTLGLFERSEHLEKGVLRNTAPQNDLRLG
jgi:hypothetical protein